MSDRFDLEQAIMNCWNITDDLKISDSPEYIAALVEVYEKKFEHAMNVLEECIRNGAI